MSRHHCRLDDPEDCPTCGAALDARQWAAMGGGIDRWDDAADARAAEEVFGR